MESEPTKNMECSGGNPEGMYEKDDLLYKLATLALLSCIDEDVRSGHEYPNIPFGD